MNRWMILSQLLSLVLAVILFMGTYTPPPTCNTGEFVTYTGGSFSCSTPLGVGGITPGIIVYYNGTCPATWTEVTTARGMLIVGTPASGTDGGTVGVAYTNLQDKSLTPTFSGNASTLSHAGTSVSDHASHTHDYTQILNHTHTVNVTDPGHIHVENQNSATTGGLSGWGARDTSTSTSVASGYSTASATTGVTASTLNPVGGVASGTTTGPATPLTHAVTQPNTHSYTPTGSISTIASSNLLAYIQLRVCQKD